MRDGGELLAFALWHSTPLAAGRAKDEVRVLKLVARSLPAFERLLDALHGTAAAERVGRIAIRCQTEYAEAYLRLVDQRVLWQNRAQFLAVAAQMMRRVLVDHARRGNMAKRSGKWVRVTLAEHVAEMPVRDVQLLDLDAALARLSTFDPRASQIAELRFFGGLSLQETAHVLGLSIATVEREWQAARAWLYSRLTGSRRNDA